MKDDIRANYVSSTENEKLFLNGIVTGQWVKTHSLERARKALIGYIATAHTRLWDAGVSTSVVSNHAKRLLAEMP